MTRSCVRAILVCAFILLLTVPNVYGQVGTTANQSARGYTIGPSSMSGEISISSVSTNKLSFRTVQLVCGGKAQAGTPIAANESTSGIITISGIPTDIGLAPTTVVRAHLFWAVLTDGTAHPPSAFVTFNGVPVEGLAIGVANESPCFPQDNSRAYRADVTSLVPSPGNGIYTVSGFPGTPDFAEGVTLQVLWSNPNAALKEDNLYHGIGTAPFSLAVTQAQLFSQEMQLLGTNATGPVSATLYEVIGNGQNASENLRFTAACGEINLDNTLNGSTVAYPAGTCASSLGGTQCFWDDDVVDVSAAFACSDGNGATSARLSSDPTVSSTTDCFDWPALNLLTSTDMETAITLCGVYVDNQCPPTASYRNHGQYVSCVSHAAQRVLAGLPWGGSCPRAEIQSACVNPRARTNKP